MKWLVISGMHGGYLPDTAEECDSKKQAEQYAAALAREYRDEFHEYENGVWGPSYKVSGNAKVGYEIARRPYSSTDLGWYIEVQEAGE